MKTPRQKTVELLQPILDRHGFTFDQVVTGKRTHPEMISCRNECMWRMRQQGQSLPKIGRAFNRDHKTVLYGIGSHLVEVNRGDLYPKAAMYALKNYARAAL